MMFRPTSNQWWSFKNTGSVAVDPHGCVEITGSTSPRRGVIRYNAQRPGTTLRVLYALNGGTEVPVGGYGRLTFDIAPGLAASGTPAMYQEWGPTVNSYELTTKRPGFFSFGLSLDSGARHLFRPHPITKVIGKLDGSLSYQGTATVSVWGGAQGSEADESFNLTAGEWVLASGESLASGTQVTCEWIGGGWYVTTYNVCPS